MIALTLREKRELRELAIVTITTILLSFLATMVLLLYFNFRIFEIKEELKILSREQKDLVTKVDNLIEFEKKAKKELELTKASMECVVSTYNAEQKQTDKTPKQTAIMSKPVPGWTCAVSRDLMHWLGGKIWIEGVGVRYVNDLMNQRFSSSVDVLIGKKEKHFKDKRTVVFLGKG